MSAGTGIRHSEFNASQEEPVHLLQFWIEPGVRGLEPSWEQRRFSGEERSGRLLPVASGDARDGILRIHQDASVYISSLEQDQQVTHELEKDRRAYLFVIEGAVSLSGQPLAAGDQARVTKESQLELQAKQESEMILLDLR